MPEYFGLGRAHRMAGSRRYTGTSVPVPETATMHAGTRAGYTLCGHLADLSHGSYWFQDDQAPNNCKRCLLVLAKDEPGRWRRGTKR